MFIEQIIEFEFRVSGPPGCWPYMYSYNCSFFHGKTKISWKILSGSLLTAKILHETINTLLPPTCAKSLTKFSPKMEDFKFALDLNCK